MDFCTSYFGKPLASLAYDDIVTYFSEPRLENATIEYKSFATNTTFDAAFKKIARGISSFLNSEGGILIWGAPQGKNVSPTKEDIFEGNLCPVTEFRSKDSIINRIGTEITPIPPGVNIRILEQGKRYVYIFEIQESIAKPHQFDFRYYIRLDGQSRPAPHYLVDALMKRVTYPNICGVIQFRGTMTGGYELNMQNTHILMSIGIFNCSEFQNEESVSFRLICNGGFFVSGKSLFQIKNTNPRFEDGGHELIYSDFAAVLHFGTPMFYDTEIAFNSNSLQKNNGLVELFLTFGGKWSPAKSSVYVIHVHADYTWHLIHCDENILLADVAKRASKSMQDTLRGFTGR